MVQFLNALLSLHALYDWDWLKITSCLEIGMLDLNRVRFAKHHGMKVHNMLSKGIFFLENQIFFVFFVLAGNRLFTLNPEDVDFYLPQLLNLCIDTRDLSDYLLPYLKYRYGVIYCFDRSID